jgi:hypothetical protein
LLYFSGKFSWFCPGPTSDHNPYSYLWLPLGWDHRHAPSTHHLLVEMETH